MESSRRNLKNTILCGIVLLVLCLLSLRLGSAKMTWQEFFRALSDTNKQTPFGVILYSVRLPRIAGAIISGAGLGMSGAILQTIVGNKMASPNLVGVNSGAGFAVIVSLSLFPSLFAFTPFFAMVGAFVATLFIIGLSKKIGMTRNTVILVGLALSSILSAGISLVTLLDSDILVSYNAFSIGSLSSVSFDDLYIPFFMVVLSLITGLIMADKLDILTLGDSTAHSLGINVNRTRMICMLVASACASAAVSFAGLLGFVGLMAPHIARFFFDERAKHMIPSSAVIGAVLVVISDLMGRTLFSPSELPAGIFLALSGAPFFLLLLIAGRRNHNA
ncbi:MAG: iron ABC transporter permease [Ruminococcaceae bacterium]|nr:iron ABC transporter permease [Oscillospiraceae bacterium]